ncbi:MAG: TerB family tellurite resistance protein [Acidobacteriota bacterium]
MTPNMAKCLLVSKVLVADGMMTDEEHGFLSDLMQELGLTEAERAQVIELEGWDEAEPIVKALSLEERRELLARLVDAASADGHLSPQELSTVKRVAAALGIDQR